MKPNDLAEGGECIVPAHPVPPQEVSPYSVTRDPHSENDISNYVEAEPRGETVHHVERIKQETLCSFALWFLATVSILGDP